MYDITVGICCYQQEEWLYRCLRSLASQTYPLSDFEVIVVNDDPKSDLTEICDTFTSEDLLQIRLLNNKENLGLPGSLNRILKVARGQYFVRVDADDYVSKHYLHVLSLFLNMNRDYQAVTCDYRKVNEVGTPISTHRFVDEPIACGTMFTYESLCNLRFYSEGYQMREGHDLLKRFAEKYQICHLPFPLYRYRIHETNRTHNSDEVAKFDALLSESEANVDA